MPFAMEHIRLPIADVSFLAFFGGFLGHNSRADLLVKSVVCDTTEIYAGRLISAKGVSTTHLQHEIPRREVVNTFHQDREIGIAVAVDVTRDDGVGARIYGPQITRRPTVKAAAPMKWKVWLPTCAVSASIPDTSITSAPLVKPAMWSRWVSGLESLIVLKTK